MNGDVESPTSNCSQSAVEISSVILSAKCEQTYILTDGTKCVTPRSTIIGMCDNNDDDDDSIKKQYNPKISHIQTLY